MDAFPLTAPNGTVYAWACGRCRHTGSQPSKFVNLTDEDVARFAENSRENAARCCSCKGCGAYVSLRDSWSERGDFCEACWPAEKLRRDEVAARYQAQEAVAQAACEESLKKAKDREAALALVQLIRDLSEDLYCAGWMSGIEFELWGDIMDPRAELATPPSYSAHNRQALIDYGTKAHGWWYWDRDAHTELFVTLDEMRERYAAYWQKIGAQS